jgi:flavodoxin
MQSLVIYGTRTGNTQTIAEAIAAGLRPHGPVQVLPADEALPTLPEGTDLVVIGGPTEGHGMTEPLKHFLDQLAPGSLGGVAAAGFDTRLRWPRWLSGSAALGITKRLRAAGARVIAPAESFIVTTKPVALEPGEAERATAWATLLAASVAASQATTTSPAS